MKLKKRLPQEEAELLGLKIKPKSTTEFGNPTYSITKKEWIEVLEFRDNKNIKEVITKSIEKTKEIPFDLSAWSLDGKIMSIDEFCETHKLPRNDVKNYRLCTHTKVPTYNITFNEQASVFKDDFDYLGELTRQLENCVVEQRYKETENKKEGMITITDLHFGAYISAMIKTPEFNISILCDMLESASRKVNIFKYKKVHVHLLGDLIESFTGLNHKNSWKGLDKGMFGVSAIKLFVELFIKHFLNNIDNLGKIKLVAGNHDRLTSDNNEDVDGGAAELIAWGLQLKGYDVEFSTSVITHVVDNICNILNHGHHSFTKKKSTQEMCWEYGVKGMFNHIKEGHLHSRIKKLDAKQLKNFSMISDDNIDCRREVCPSLFTGNSYSEYGGWSTLAGYQISEANDRGNGVNVFDFSL